MNALRIKNSLNGFKALDCLGTKWDLFIRAGKVERLLRLVRLKVKMLTPMSEGANIHKWRTV